MKIRKDGIYKTIDSKDYGIYQKSGWEKVIVETVVEVKIAKEPEPIVENVEVVETEPVINELPKSKKKKK